MGDETKPEYPPGSPEYEAYRAKLQIELDKFARGETPYEYPVTHTTHLSVNGSTSIVITPPLPCGLMACVAELHITSKHGDTQRVHLSAQQRRELVGALGGTL